LIEEDDVKRLGRQACACLGHGRRRLNEVAIFLEPPSVELDELRLVFDDEDLSIRHENLRLEAEW